jgi:hypothetical protein
MIIDNTELILYLLKQTSNLPEEEIKNVFKDNIIDDQWVVMDKTLYNKYKNKITINNISLLKKDKQKDWQEYITKDVTAFLETKDYYINLKYNINFIAFSISEREYQYATQPLVLVCFNRFLVKNFKSKENEPPNLLKILKVLRWKITKKALNKIDQDYDYL